MFLRCRCFVVLACVAIAGLSSAVAQNDSVETLTLDQIMSDPDWISRSPERPQWSDDGEQIYYQRKRKGTDVRDWFRVNVATAKSAKVPLDELATVLPASGDESADHERIVFTRDGDLFVRNLTAGSRRQLTRTSATESGAAFLAGEQRIQFRRDGTLLIRHLKSGLESEPVVLRFEDAPPEDATDAKKDSDEKDKPFIAEQEHELFDYLRREEDLRDAAKKADRDQDKANTANVNRPIYLGKGFVQVSQTLARNARWMAVVVTKAGASERGRKDQMPVWVRDDAYVENRPVRELVGDEPESAQQLKLIDIRERTVIDVDLSTLPEITADRLAALKEAQPDPPDQPDEKPPVEDSAAEESKEPARPRPVEIQSVRFSDDSKSLLFQCYSHDNKDRWIARLDPEHADKPEALKVLHHRFDEAWIGSHDYPAGWVKGTRSTWFTSEATSFSHLYLADEAGVVRQLTDGPFEVSDVHVSRDGQTIFFTSNETHPGVFELWSVDIASGERKQLTTLGGVNEFELSRDESSVVALHSNALRPPELMLVQLKSNDKPKQLTRTATKEFRSVKWTPPQFVEVPSRHGGVIHARLYRPEDASPDDGDTDRDAADGPRPAVLFVHGAGYLQNAHQGWSGYFREFMFHTLLTRRGFVVLDMDYRASAGYGRDWRTAIYRQMGTPEVEDLSDGVSWLAEHHNVDASRVGVYGGSYGGFLTLMSLFREPDLFACGAALRPVTDWAHYNHGYTSNILNTPAVDPVAYQQSSPILFADGLQRPLLICHGMIDDNVFFKDTVRLTQRLIELKKDNWNVAMYPVEPHGFRQPSSWRDEYQRILDLFERELLGR